MKPMPITSSTRPGPGRGTDIALLARLANRIGAQQFDLGQLKVMQEIITMSVFVPFVVLYMGQPLKLDYLWAALCLVGAAYFMFRS